MTRRAKGKSFAGTWENSGGAAKAGETSRVAIARELCEETGIHADPEEFEVIGTDRDAHTHYHFYALQRQIPIEQIVLQPGETDDAKWVSFQQVHEMIAAKEVCWIIAHQFLRQEADLRRRQSAQDNGIKIG
jgi:8-oxo-dGTP pyrophosphatase MutT (NUDIX family)